MGVSSNPLDDFLDKLPINPIVHVEGELGTASSSSHFCYLHCFFLIRLCCFLLLLISQLDHYDACICLERILPFLMIFSLRLFEMAIPFHGFDFVEGILFNKKYA